MIFRIIKPNDIIMVVKLVQVVCNYAYDARAHCCGGILVFNTPFLGLYRNIHVFCFSTSVNNMVLKC
jgi:hypothetical protein